MNNKEFKKLLKNHQFTPVAVFEDEDAALRTSEILLENDVSIIEITLRTKNSLKCIEAVAKKFSQMTVGAGSVFTLDALRDTIDRGSQFAVSPVCTKEIGEFIKKKEYPWVPGAASPNELFQALNYSNIVKVFPANPLGGPSFIKAMTAPFKMMDLSIVPTGGISKDNINDYLALDIVINCGLSWIVDSSVITKNDWKIITERIIKVKEIVGSL